jgi:hypothetical protein
MGGIKGKRLFYLSESVNDACRGVLCGACVHVMDVTRMWQVGRLALWLDRNQGGKTLKECVATVWGGGHGTMMAV